jgi:hypothetical protein
MAVVLRRQPARLMLYNSAHLAAAGLAAAGLAAAALAAAAIAWRSDAPYIR